MGRCEASIMEDEVIQGCCVQEKVARIDSSEEK